MDFRYTSAGFARTSLLLVSGFFLLLMTADAALAQSQIGAKIIIHLTPSAGGSCGNAPASLACNGGNVIQTVGALDTDYDAYVVAADLDTSAGFMGAEFGIFYHYLQESGLSVSSWTSCADLQAPGPSWPDPGSGIELNFESCRGTTPDPGDANGRGMVVLGAFQASAVSLDHLYITRRFDTGNTPISVTDCASNVVNPDAIANAGAAAFGAGDGYNPCTETWDRFPVACCMAGGCQQLDPLYCDYLGGEPQFSSVYLITCANADCANTVGAPDATGGGRPILGNFSPNPFRGNRAGAIAFRMPAEGPARVVVYDLSGRPVKTVFDGAARAGWNEARWDGTDLEGRPVPNGIYHYRLLAGDTMLTRKVVLIRE